MKILILVDCYLPSPKSGAKLIHDLAVELVRQGHEPIVVAASDTLRERSRLSVEEGVTVLRVRTGRIKGASRVVRAINEIRLSRVVWRAGKSFFTDHPCSIVIYYSPTIFFGALAARLKRLWGCRTYLILRDIFPQWAVDAGALRRGSLPHRYFRRKELQQYDAADVIGVQSPANLTYFREAGLAERYRLEVLWHWAPLTQENVPSLGYRARLGLDGKVVFFYGGNIGVAQDMDNIVRLAESLHGETGIHFLLMGDGSEVPRLRRLIADRRLTNITIEPAIGQQEYLGVLSEFDVGLITLDRHLTTQNLPGKMLGYLHYAMPTLASVNPGNDLKDLIEEHEVGLVSLNGDDRSLREDALRLSRDEGLRRRLGANGRRLLEASFSSRRAADQILAHAGGEPGAR